MSERENKTREREEEKKFRRTKEDDVMSSYDVIGISFLSGMSPPPHKFPMHISDLVHHAAKQGGIDPSSMKSKEKRVKREREREQRRTMKTSPLAFHGILPIGIDHHPLLPPCHHKDQ